MVEARNNEPCLCLRKSDHSNWLLKSVVAVKSREGSVFLPYLVAHTINYNIVSFDNERFPSIKTFWTTTKMQSWTHGIMGLDPIGIYCFSVVFLFRLSDTIHSFAFPDDFLSESSKRHWTLPLDNHVKPIFDINWF